MARKTTPTGNDSLWQPKFTFDLSTGSAAGFRSIVEAFNDWRKQEPRPDLHLADGWHMFTPEICEQALMVNAGNRQPSFATVNYYAKQMLVGDWQETGQPVIFDVDGNMVDAQHREWAGYLSGATFTSYVVNQTKPIKNGFAYIDNSKTRSIKDAIFTAGMNGLSGALAQVVKLAWQHDAGALTPTGVSEVERLTPIRAIDYVEERQTLKQGLRLVAGDHAAASAVIAHPDVAGYMACLILEQHDGFVLDEFMEEMAVESETPGSPIASFQAIMAHDRLVKKPMKRHQVLGYLIKSFNAWVQQEQVKRLSLRVNEPFPQIIGKAQEPEQQDAAE